MEKLSPLAVQKLKKSPIFNFSLSSKELFHSNFLAWMLNELITDEVGNYTSNGQFEMFWKLFCKYGRLSEEFNGLIIKFDSIKREEKNLDLLFSAHIGDNNYFDVIIENKVKSIPYIGQLKEYASKAKKGSRLILLTLHCPENLNAQNRLINAGDDAVWCVVTYSDLKKCLSNFLEQPTTLSSYNREIIADYIQLLGVLIAVSEEAEISESEFFNWADEISNTVIRYLRDLRLADFYLKKKYALLADLVKNRVGNVKEISINSGFSNSTGFLDIKYKVDDSLNLGIQIQANMFRLVIEGQNAYHTAMELDSKGWFDFQIIEHIGIVYPKNNGLNKYGENFRYKYVNIPSRTKLVKVLDYIEYYITKFTNYNHE